MFEIGDEIEIMADRPGSRSACFQRFRAGVKESYRITYKWRYNDNVDARRIGVDGRLESYTYTFKPSEVAPPKITLLELVEAFL